MEHPELHRFRPAVLAFLVAVSVALELAVHVALGMETVYSHFFYLPIVLISNSTRRKHDEAIGDTAGVRGPQVTGGAWHARIGEALLRHFAPPNAKKMRGERDVPGLVRALGHKDPGVQYAAAEALGELREPSAVPPLMELLTADRYSGVRWKAAEALARIGEPAVVPLIGALHHPDEDVRWKAAIALGEIGDDRAIQPLIELLGDPDRFVQSRAAYALGEFGTRVTPLLCRALATGPPSVRRGAALALQKIRDPAALDDLLRAAVDPDGSVRSAALEALMHHGDEGYRRILLYLSTATATERAKVFHAIREVSNQRLILGFVPVLHEADGESREFIQSVIGAGEQHELSEESSPGA